MSCSGVRPASGCGARGFAVCTSPADQCAISSEKTATVPVTTTA